METRIHRDGYVLVCLEGGDTAAIELDNADDGDGWIPSGHQALLRYLPPTYHCGCALREALAYVGARVEV